MANARLSIPNQSPRIEVVYRLISDLRMDPRNPRVHSPKVIAGHGRLGSGQVPTIMLEQSHRGSGARVHDSREMSLDPELVSDSKRRFRAEYGCST